MFTGDIHSVHPPLMLEGGLEFWVLWGGQNIFDFGSGELFYEGERVIFLWGNSVHSTSIFTF